jgi:hypothetical protein
VDYKHLAMRRGPCDMQRQARKLFSGPSPTTKTRLLFFNRTQSSVVIGLLTGHNTLRRHLHLTGLTNSSLYRKCGTEEETSVHILCECEALASFRHAYQGSFFLDPENINLLKTKRITLYIRNQSVPRCKHFPPRL